MRNTALEISENLKRNLATIDSALVIENVSHASVDNNGTVELYVDFGYEIKKGNIIKYYNNFVLSGNAIELLNSISAFDNDFTWKISRCSKDGNGIFVSHGAPSVLLRGEIIGH
jgi:predicted Zn-dependent protease